MLFLHAAGAGAEHDGRQLVIGLAIFRQIQMRRHARGIAPDADGALFDVIGQSWGDAVWLAVFARWRRG